ncbi:MAG: DUF1844 domain-containing protein [Thermoanaerobaculaceae bacterium]|nr:DUF1844 domain-containing protein [Thermoanaerobaculaceae bacterium]MDI9622170.1 DUF1844 domain-containing protein [Acidobacteriota bacterium]NLH10069.1 DUF1844 domain-containing protein [Holophagae bacterium]HPW54893.1 DUF1844 domain-containing protein [Thermoanaerobaculaceae bacterium]
MEDRPDRKQVKVIDRRWLTPEGEARHDVDLSPPEPPQPAELPAPIPPPPEPPQPSPREAGHAALPSQVLLDTVDFLAQYAMAFLTGQVPGVPRNPDAARLFLDMLAVVQERARAHASLQEAKVLDDVLYQLRLQLVATSR